MTATTTDIGPVIDAHTPARRAVQQLRNTLRLNTLTSLFGGLIAAVIPGTLDRLVGTGHSGWMRVVGVFLVVFAVEVFVVAGSRTSRLVRWTPVVVAGDACWVVASIGTIVAGWYSRSGVVVIGAVAAMVGTFAVRQTITWRRVRLVLADVADAALIDESPPVEVAHFERSIVATTQQAWDVITDHALYGELAMNLSKVHANTGGGLDLRRTCVSKGGKEWREACTLWDENHRFEVAVDTSNYPYPIHILRGSWWTEPTDSMGQCLVGMDFKFQPQPSLMGRLFVAGMHAGFPLIVRRIMRGWARAITRNVARLGSAG